jgi:hypothetical protein
VLHVTNNVDGINEMNEVDMPDVIGVTLIEYTISAWLHFVEFTENCVIVTEIAAAPTV